MVSRQRPHYSSLQFQNLLGEMHEVSNNPRTNTIRKYIRVLPRSCAEVGWACTQSGDGDEGFSV